MCSCSCTVEKKSTIQYGYRKWGTHGRVFSQTLAKGTTRMKKGKETDECNWEAWAWKKQSGHEKKKKSQRPITFLSLCHRRHVAALCMLYKVIFNSNHCFFSELPSASGRVRHTRAAAAAHPLELEVSRCLPKIHGRTIFKKSTFIFQVNIQIRDVITSQIDALMTRSEPSLRINIKCINVEII